MPTIGWIDALRTYNAGMPSWCVPRKGTPGYDRVMRIRQGEQTKGFKEVLEDLERKTSGKPKKEKKSMAIDLSSSKEEVKVPTIAEGVGSVKTDRSTKKMSGSNNKKAMAVVPVNYVAEGGSKEESKTVAKGGSKPPKDAKGGSKKASNTAPPGATTNDLYYASDRDSAMSLWREDTDRWVRIGEWTGKGDTLTFKTGSALVRDKTAEAKVRGLTKTVHSMKGFTVGKKITNLYRFNTLGDLTKDAARTALESLGYTYEESS